MREIKFRAWDGMEWVYSSAVDYVEIENTWRIFDQLNEEWLYCLQPYQYTGLKDKNGREIYEGDLYKFTISHDMYNPESGHTTFEVVHVKAVTFEDGAFYHGTHLLSEIIEFDDSFTYVGNIYENPELLEESQNGTK